MSVRAALWREVRRNAWELSKEHFQWVYPVVTFPLVYGLLWWARGWQAMIENAIPALIAGGVAFVVALVVLAVNFVRAVERVHVANLAAIAALEKERDAAVKAASLTKGEDYPQIEAVIGQVGWGEHLMSPTPNGPMTNMTYVWVVVRITNRGASTALSDYSLLVKQPSGAILKGRMLIPPETLNVEGVQVPYGEPLQVRTMKAVERGIPAVGRLMAIFPPPLTVEMITGPGVFYEVTFRDPWYPKTPLHSASIEWQTPRLGPVMQVPGLGAQHAPIRQSQPPAQKQKPSHRHRRGRR